MGAKSLTDEQVRQLRTRRVINKEYLADLAREFGISEGHALRIVRGEFRAAAGGPLDEGRRMPARRDMSGTSNPNSVLQPEDKALIRQLVADGARHQMVADVFRVSRASVTRIANGKQLPNMKSYYLECTCGFNTYDATAFEAHRKQYAVDGFLPPEHFLVRDVVDRAAKGFTCCYPGCSDPDSHVHFPPEGPPKPTRGIRNCFCGFRTGNAVLWRLHREQHDREIPHSVADSILKVALENGLLSKEDVREAISSRAVTVLSGSEHDYWRQVAEWQTAPGTRWSLTCEARTVPKCVSSSPSGSPHLPGEDPVPEDIRVYGEVTGRSITGWSTWSLGQWRREYEATGQTLAYDKMLEKVTLHIHSDLLDGPLPDLPDGKPTYGAFLPLILGGCIPFLAWLIVFLVT